VAGDRTHEQQVPSAYPDECRAGADVAGCMFMILGNAILQGQPHFPHDMVEVSGVIKEHHVRFVYIDPSLVLPERFGRSKRSPTHPD
jgi:hypothetical protein